MVERIDPTPIVGDAAPTEEGEPMDVAEGAGSQGRRVWWWLGWLPQQTLLLMVRVYQRIGSPLMRWGGVECRFEPTCSHYFAGAVAKYGPVRGTYRGLCRVCRCHPWHPGGYDPP